MVNFSNTKTVVITGAGSGIGRALALAYGEPGRALLLIGRQPAALESTAALLRDRGAKVMVGVADVRDAPALDALAARCHGAFGEMGIVIANAGIGRGTSSSEPTDRDVFVDIVQINLIGVENTVSAFLPYLGPGGRVAGIASIAGLRGLPGVAAYSASKAGLIAYLESLRLELRKGQIRVCCIAPGYIDTPMTADNHYPMPWLMPVSVAAMKMRRAIDRGRPWLVLPWQMAVVAWMLRRLPIPVYDFLIARVSGKARRISEK